MEITYKVDMKEEDFVKAVEVALINLPDFAMVVRCKDCKFRYTTTCFSRHETADNDYCSCGAKMDKE